MDKGPEAQFFEALGAGRFQIQRCEDCSRAVFYPRVICPHCGSDCLHWFTPSGRGTVYSTTVVRRAETDGGDYNVALIDLEEGPRMMSSLCGIAPDKVAIGMQVVFHSIDPQTADAVYFAPSSEAGS